MSKRDQTVEIRPADNGYIVYQEWREYKDTTDGGMFDYDHRSKKTVFLNYAEAVDFVSKNAPEKNEDTSNS